MEFQFYNLITDYLDDLRYLASTSNSLHKHRVSKEELIKKIIEIKKVETQFSYEQLKVLFDEVIEANTIKLEGEISSERLWKWNFSLDEWECQYSHEDNKFTFEKVMDSFEIKSILDIKSKRLKEDLSRKIIELNPREFEIFVVKLFENLSWIKKMFVTQYSQDGGIDFEGFFHPQGVSIPSKLIGQAKHMKSKVGGPDMRNFQGALGQLPPNSVGYFVSTGGFNPEAKSSAQKWPQTIELYDLNRVIEIMIENNFGINPSIYTLTEMDSQFWSFTDE